MSSFIHHAAIVSGTTLLSRLLGFVRDAAMAWLLGAGPVADALSAALRLPWAVRRLLGEGALSLSLTAACAREVNPCGLALAVAKRLAPYLLVGTGLLVLAAPWIGDVLAPGAGEAVTELITPLLRLCLPYTMLAVVSACAMAGLHAARRFVVPGTMPIMFNVVVIGFVLAAVPLRNEPQAAALLVAAGVLIGGIVQWLPCVVVRLAHNAPCPVLAPESVSLALRRLPAGLLGAGMAQGAFLLAGIMASWLPHGHMAALFYAERLLEFPMGVLGAALSMAAVPEIQRNRTVVAPLLEWTLTLHVAAAAGLIAVAEPLAATVLGHGAFDVAAVRQTAAALQAYAWGLPAYALSRPLLVLAHTNGRDGQHTAPRLSPSVSASLWGLGVCLLTGGLLTSGLLSEGLFSAPALTGIGPAVGVSAGLWAQTLCLFVRLNASEKQKESHSGLFTERHRLCRIGWGLVAGAAAYFAAAGVLFCLPERAAWLRLLLAVPTGIAGWGLALYTSPACRDFYRFRRAA